MKDKKSTVSRQSFSLYAFFPTFFSIYLPRTIKCHQRVPSLNSAPPAI